MELMNNLYGFVRPGLPLVATLVFGILVLIGIKKLLDKRYEGQADKNMRMQLIMMLLSFLLLVVVIIVSPINDNQKGQILSLIGIVLSAAIALSSTTFVGNAMAGMMMRTIKGFRVGDFLSVGESFGRVSERGLFHVEIQTEQRDLITLPNLTLVTNPVKVVRSSGTVISAEVSIGYDVSRKLVKESMLSAAEKCELQEAFVHVVQLGDFSVVYRVSGLLMEVKQLLSARSRIRECVLDELHAAGIEIVSPTFMNTRQLSSDDRFVPRVAQTAEPEISEAAPENVVFDKAEEAESLEKLRNRHESMGKEITDLEKSLKETDDQIEKTKIEKEIDRRNKSREALRKRIKIVEEQKNDDKLGN